MPTERPECTITINGHQALVIHSASADEALQSALNSVFIAWTSCTTWEFDLQRSWAARLYP